MALDPNDYVVDVIEGVFPGKCVRTQLVHGFDVNGEEFEGYLLEAPRSHGTLEQPRWQLNLKPYDGGKPFTVHVAGRVSTFEVRNRRKFSITGAEG